MSEFLTKKRKGDGQPSLFSDQGATRLAERLWTYWFERGYDIELRVRYVCSGVYAVDLVDFVNGIPSATARARFLSDFT